MVFITTIFVSEKVKEYFGVSIAMYFAFLGFYTKAVIIPALIGVYLYVYSGTNQARRRTLSTAHFYLCIWYLYGSG